MKILVQTAFNSLGVILGLGAQWHFLCDENREVIKQMTILDETEGKYGTITNLFQL